MNPNDFIEAFRKLFRDNKVTVVAHDQYNGQEEYVRTDHYLVIDGQPYYSETVDEIINKLTSGHEQISYSPCLTGSIKTIVK